MAHFLKKQGHFFEGLFNILQNFEATLVISFSTGQIFTVVGKT